MNQNCLFDNFYLRLPKFRSFLCTMYTLTIITAVSLNFAVMFTIWKTSSLHKPSYILLANVALVDFLVGAIVQTSVLAINFAAMYDWAEVHCYAMIICRISGYWLITVSLFTLTVISIDRLLAVKLKNRYQSVVTSKRILLILISCWIGSLMIAIILLTRNLPLNILLGAAISLIAVLLTTLTISYCMAFYFLKKYHHNSVSPGTNNQNTSSNFNASKYRQSLKTMVFAVSLIVTSYLPYLCSAFAMALENVVQFDESAEVVLIYRFMLVGELFITNNSTMNPLLFLWRMKDLRGAAKSAVKKLFRGQDIVESFRLNNSAT